MTRVDHDLWLGIGLAPMAQGRAERGAGVPLWLGLLWSRWHAREEGLRIRGRQVEVQPNALASLVGDDRCRLHPHRPGGVDHHPRLAGRDEPIAVGRDHARALLAGTRR